MKIFGIIIAVIFGLLFLGVAGFGIKLLFFPVNVAQQELNTAYDIVDKTIDADNAIYNYRWFKQQKEDIDAQKSKLVNARISYDDFKLSLSAERSEWGFEDKTEDARLRAVVLGIQNQLVQTIANYNARSKMADVSIFKDSLIPNYVDAVTFIKK